MTGWRRHRYVGPDDVRRAAATGPGAEIRTAGDLGSWVLDGYCPEPSSWPAVAAALDRAGIAHPGGYTVEIIFRRCTGCGERNIVRDGDFTCAVCGESLPPAWNVDDF